ncbi:MAG TPA: PEGA domain-containing protein, partial [Kofleriaceae bacterium]|nr:PEGA domain-containing protein [Kofleriaceae bacterium]
DGPEDTEMSAPPTALLPPGGARLPPMPVDVRGQAHTSSRRRIAIVAAAVAAAGVAAMLLFFSGGSSDADGKVTTQPVAPFDSAGRSAAGSAQGERVEAMGPADAAVAAEAEPMTAELEVITVPDKAAISLGPDRPIGVSPAKFTDLAPGTVKVSVELTGYQRLARDVTLAPGDRRTVELQLLALPPPPPPPPRNLPVRPAAGALTVRTTPYSEVWLGSRRLGETPFAGYKLPAGTHTLTFKHPGRKPTRRTITIRPGQTTKLNFALP